MNINGYECEKLGVAAQGFNFIGMKGGKKYQIKQYLPAKPKKNGNQSAALYEKKNKKFERRVEYRGRINRAIREFTSAGGNIVIPSEEFIASTIHDDGTEWEFYWEATEFIENVIPTEQIPAHVASLSEKNKLLIMTTAAAALSAVHQHGIVHSDLKLGNVLLAKNSAGNTVAKLIDFDGSYFLNDKNTRICGDEVYCSPELTHLIDERNTPEQRTAIRDALTEKSDIFSLGLIYHFYLAGCLPEPTNLPEGLQAMKEKGQTVHSGLALLAGGKLQLSNKITNLKHILLISDMLELEPTKRPSAAEVLSRIKGPDISNVIEEPWGSHGIELDKAKILAAGIVVFKKIKAGDIEKYQVIDKSGRKSELTKDELIAKNYAKIKLEEKFCEPWAEHGGAFDESACRKFGYIAAERAEMIGKKGYNFYRSDRTKVFLRVDTLRAKGMLSGGVASTASKPTAPKSAPITKPTPKPSEIKTGFCEPWAEHNIVFNTDALSSKNIVGIEQGEMLNKKGYFLYYSDGRKQFMALKMLEFYGYVSKK